MIRLPCRSLAKISAGSRFYDSAQDQLRQLAQPESTPLELNMNSSNQSGSNLVAPNLVEPKPEESKLEESNQKLQNQKLQNQKPQQKLKPEAPNRTVSKRSDKSVDPLLRNLSGDFIANFIIAMPLASLSLAMLNLIHR
jgi:cell pole-organizing protein PopZ